MRAFIFVTYDNYGYQNKSWLLTQKNYIFLFLFFKHLKIINLLLYIFKLKQ